MKRAWAFLIALLVAACGPTKEEAMGACHMDALKTYPEESGPYSTKLDDFAMACMTSKGYHLNILLHACSGRGDFLEDAGCYTR